MDSETRDIQSRKGIRILAVEPIQKSMRISLIILIAIATQGCSYLKEYERTYTVTPSSVSVTLKPLPHLSK